LQVDINKRVRLNPLILLCKDISFQYQAFTPTGAGQFQMRWDLQPLMTLSTNNQDGLFLSDRSAHLVQWRWSPAAPSKLMIAAIHHPGLCVQPVLDGFQQGGNGDGSNLDNKFSLNHRLVNIHLLDKIHPIQSSLELK
jgi:hypothetical protein